MKHFMLFIREDLAALEQMSEEQMQTEIQLMTQWGETLSKGGHYIQGDPLEPATSVVHKDTITSDGPFIEVKEGVSGYIILQAETPEQAAQLAQTCPLLGQTVKRIDVRPILKF